MQESMECCFGMYPCRSKTPVTDLNQMNSRSAPFHKQSGCQIEYSFIICFVSLFLGVACSGIGKKLSSETTVQQLKTE
jgi:hypothetical protein